MMTDSSTDAWTFVPLKKGRKGRYSKPPTSYSELVDNDATLESLQALFNKHKTQWSKNDVRKMVYMTFERLYLNEQPRITKAVCVGLGSLTTINLDFRARSFAQLAVFLDAVEHLNELHRTKIVMYAQEPRFTALDKEFLATIGITSLDYLRQNEHGRPPLGPIEAYIDSNTFVADFFGPIDVTQQLLNFKPRLLVSAMPGAIDKALSEVTTFDTEHKKILQENYKWHTFPEHESFDGGKHCLRGLYVCGLVLLEDGMK